MPEGQLSPTGPENTSIPNPPESPRHTVPYIVAGLLAVLIVILGIFGFQYLKLSPEQGPDSALGTTQFDFTDAELQSAKNEVQNKLRVDFGFREFLNSHVIEDKDNPIQGENETLHNMWVDVTPFPGVLDTSGTFVAQKQLQEIYESQSKEIDSSKYGAVLVGTSDIRPLPLVSWVSYSNGVPLIFSTSFNLEGIDDNDIQLDFDSKSPLLLKSILEKYPPDSELTRDLVIGIDLVRSQNRGYATTKILRKEISSSGYEFTLTEFDNFAQTSNSCDMFVSGWSVESAKELVSCEVKITTSANEHIYTDEQLKTLGGLPDKWISGNEFVTSRTEGGEGMGETGYKFVGTFNADTEKYTQILKIEQPGFYWRRALIEYEFGNTKKRLLFVEGSDAYFLYEIKTNRSLAEFFSGLNDTGSMVDYLNPLYKGELTLVGTMPLATEITDNSKYTFDINIDSRKNVVFELGDHTDFPKNYSYTIGGGVKKVN